MLLIRTALLCERHWPLGYEKKIDCGKERPNSVPSVFKCVPSSSIPTPLPPQWTTKKSTSSARTFMEDEIDAFNKKYIICSFEFLKSNIDKLSPSHNSAVLKNILDDEVQIQSKKLVTGTGVPMFLLRIDSDLIQ